MVERLSRELAPVSSHETLASFVINDIENEFLQIGGELTYIYACAPIFF